MTNVLIIGSGGREHALTWKISESTRVKNIFVAPGSHGIQQVVKAENVPLNLADFKQITEFCQKNDVSLVVVGPEDPLANGIADVLLEEGIQVFGPARNGARIEWDKDWAKTFMDKHDIPTAKWTSFSNANEAKHFINNAPFPALVVKASGLAAGKGVVVAASKQEACEAVDEILTNHKFGTAGEVVVIEELLTGEEVSVLAFCDGNVIRPMLPAQDHKRIFDDDKGPNTGGMGAYCPCPLLKEEFEFVVEHVLQRVLDGFKKDDIKYVGVLYAGLMLTLSGPKVLEFNCRFGDPETEVILPLLDTDLYSVMTACCNGTLNKIDLTWKSNLSAVGVVMASRGYPESSSKGQEITGIEEVKRKLNGLVFHCGTALADDKLVTNGGRVLIVVALAPQLIIAASQATKACQAITFDGQQFRRDVAQKGIARSILHGGQLTYKASGVDITAGNNLVSCIKPAVKSTDRSGVIGGLGGFGGLFDPKAAGFKDPLLVSGTDGVGTKLKIAQEMAIHNTIGIDLVAMCVNDVLAHGAEPLFFLDYFACGNLDIKVTKEVINGIVEGCRQAGCSLIGGETAEMPDVYRPGEYDVAGFAVGAVERDQLMPRTLSIGRGDIVLGLPSSGVHSNGFSLVRKVLKLAGVNYRETAPFSKKGRSFGEELLDPTTIYVKTVIPAVKTGKVKAFAHITGGGLLENIPRILPQHVAVDLDAENWDVPPVFSWLATAGGISEPELLRTFNCGIGAVLIVGKEAEEEILEIIKPQNGIKIGTVVKKSDGQVVIRNFSKTMELKMKRFISGLLSNVILKKRVGVLISGSGTNLQALIDSTQSSNIGAEIVLVISNKDSVEGLKRAERAKIATKVISHKDYPNREIFDIALHEELVKAGVEIVCLAGFMRILTGDFTAKWKGKLINVHPALLPSFKGTHAQRQAIEAGVKVSGCTVHFVEEAVDRGHIITQETVSVEIDDNEETLTERIKTAEHRAFPRALEWVARGKVKIGNNNKLEWNL